MKGRKLCSFLLIGIMTICSAVNTYASSTEDEIAYAQQQKQYAESGLAQAQNQIYNLESKKQEMESYLAELNSQYEELTNTISQLSIEAAEKEEELKSLQSDLEKARKVSQEQYEAMKIRIAYMYEKGGQSTLELLLSSGNFAEFLNRAVNVVEISNYDRTMLKKYEELQVSIQQQEQKAEEEAREIEALMTERSQKQQEVQALAATTSASISEYAYQISASQEEANMLMAEIANANNSIAALMLRQQEEEAAAQEEYYQEEAYEETYDSGYEETDYAEESTEEDYYSEDTSSTYEESESDYESTSTEESGSSSGSGTYLGNFVLTAYCNCAQCCGTAGNLTASGTVPSPGRTVAMAGVPFGTQLMINGNVYTVEDLGTPYGHVDIFFSSHSDALSFGLQHADVYQLN